MSELRGGCFDRGQRGEIEFDESKVNSGEGFVNFSDESLPAFAISSAEVDM